MFFQLETTTKDGTDPVFFLDPSKLWDPIDFSRGVCPHVPTMFGVGWDIIGHISEAVVDFKDQEETGATKIKYVVISFHFEHGVPEF